MTDTQYESILKENVNELIAKSAESSEHFVSIHGYPVWESVRWTEVGSKKMLVVPLATGDGSHKFIVGVASGKEIPAVVTEMSQETRSSGHGGKRIYSLEGDILDEYGGLTTFVPRTRSNTNDPPAVWLALQGGNVVDYYEAVKTSELPFRTDAQAGTLKLKIDSTCSFWESSMGHAWFEFTDNSGNVITFGTWPKGQADQELHLNREQEKNLTATFTSVGVSISYFQLGNIGLYNQRGGANWSLLTRNCADYAAEIWSTLIGQYIPLGPIATPSALESWAMNYYK